MTTEKATVVKAEMDQVRGSGRLFFSNGNIQALHIGDGQTVEGFVQDIKDGELDWFQDYETDTPEQIVQFDLENPDNAVVYEA